MTQRFDFSFDDNCVIEIRAAARVEPAPSATENIARRQVAVPLLRRHVTRALHQGCKGVQRASPRVPLRRLAGELGRIRRDERAGDAVKKQETSKKRADALPDVASPPPSRQARAQGGAARAGSGGRRRVARTTARRADTAPGAPGTIRSAEVGRLDKVPPEHIRVRAYYLYLERGASPGRALDDWIRAERELTAPESGPAPAN
jgi:hypothetical protein